MENYQRAFIEFAIERQALRFGSFTLKSGRQSPYFFNTGVFDSGVALARLGEYYAAAIVSSGLGFDMLFGPAYKGIPLGAAVAIALATKHGRDVPFCFNRKEAKDHGEGGMTLGAPLAGRVLIVDDVISAGTSVNESVAIIGGAGATPCGVVISLDRQERGQGARSAAQEVRERHGLPVFSIVALQHVVEYLAARADRPRELAAIAAYRGEYGA
ncbi:MAG: orotate phosphoribosyltransferase [Gammaproteobacteria bacterium]|nr:orotate phosphoribosyltransferase [Gammaproteobacteria bacterium]MBI5616371.1 orotate phosphoribosyltransferase [Gammaproteobacteria bacterium]